jgi:hypothetical protein
MYLKADTRNFYFYFIFYRTSKNIIRIADDLVQLSPRKHKKIYIYIYMNARKNEFNANIL